MPASFVAPANFGLSVGAVPVRRIKPRTDRPSMPGWFPTRKGTRRLLRTESLLELDGLEQLEINADCRLIAAQPHHLVHFETLEDGSTRRRVYTPDAAVLMDDGTIAVIDFKIAEFAARDDWRLKADRLAHLYERDHGVVFQTITDEEIKVEPRFQNAKIMMLHRTAAADVEAETALMTVLAQVGLPASIDDICARCVLEHERPEVDRAFSALIGMALKGFVDLDLGEPISRASRVYERGAEIGEVP